MAPKGKGYEEALRRIAEAKDTAMASLNLRGLGLADLPPELGRIRSLKKLSLSGNHLASLPPKLGQLKSLRELDLEHNQLTSLPPGLGQLASLRKLDLKYTPTVIALNPRGQVVEKWVGYVAPGKFLSNMRALGEP